MSKNGKLDDAIDVVGQEHKSEVLDLDKKISLAMLEKSHFDELVEKSVADATVEVEKANVLADENKDFNGAKQLFVGIFNKLLTDNGVEITQDKLSEQIDKLLQGITDKSETAQEVTPAEDTAKVDEVVSEKSETETPEVEKSDDWMPYGGATTFDEAKKYIEANELLNKAYYAYSIFGAMASNIWNKEDVEVTEKVGLINKLFGDFKNSFTVDKLKELSEVDKMDNSGVELESVKAELETLKSVVNELVNKTNVEARSASVADVAVEKTDNLHPLSQTFDGLLKEVLPQEGDARKAGLQNILNRMGEEFLALNTKLEGTTEKSEVAGQEVFRAMIDEKNAPIIAQINQMGGTLNAILQTLNNVRTNQPALVQTPVSKAAVTLPQKLVAPTNIPNSGQGFSIRDIVKKTTTG